ncbi:hypothetical protein Cni_G01462 [Canna indica]|uniref:Uncharacterized protein n=1 Tax=Canna indica TaxID=4628 RepID=A0AAQ3Q108_9LILI|nr:hypothetical protein Cni_G01462 [Canna indica]
MGHPLAYSQMAKVGFLQSMDGARERLQLVKADLLVDESFDDAIDGTDDVFHSASPVFAAEDENAQVKILIVIGS